MAILYEETRVFAYHTGYQIKQFAESDMHTIHADLTVSVTELKRNYASVIEQAGDNPVALLNHNRPEAYLVPAAHYERLLSYLEDLEDAAVVRERSDGAFVEVSLDDL